MKSFVIRNKEQNIGTPVRKKPHKPQSIVSRVSRLLHNKPCYTIRSVEHNTVPGVRVQAQDKRLKKKKTMP